MSTCKSHPLDLETEGRLRQPLAAAPPPPRGPDTDQEVGSRTTSSVSPLPRRKRRSRIEYADAIQLLPFRLGIGGRGPPPVHRDQAPKGRPNLP
jgi:hypothetical protein